jgi:hypothetical protein
MLGRGQLSVSEFSGSQSDNAAAAQIRGFAGNGSRFDANYPAPAAIQEIQPPCI